MCEVASASSSPARDMTLNTAAANLRASAWTGPLMLLCGAVCIGFAPIGLRLSEFGPQATAFWRFLFALPLIAAAIYATGGRISRPSPLAVLAGLFFGLDIAFWHASLTQTSVANATFLVNLGNASVGLIAWALLRERPPNIWFGAFAVALGGAFLLSQGGASTTHSHVQGDILALIAAFMVAFYLYFTKLARRTETALQVLFWATAAELVVAGGASFAMGETLVPQQASWLLVPAALAVLAHVMGQGLITAGIGRTPAAVAGLLILVQPVTGAAIAWPLFGEELARVQILGAGMVLVGVWLAGRR